MKRFTLALSFLVLGVYLISGAASATQQRYVYEVEMRGNEMVPPVETNAWGFVRFFFDDDFGGADYTVDIKGRSWNSIVGADLYAGKPGETGEVVRHLADGDFIVTSGRIELTAEDLQHMVNGDWYVSVKSTFHPEGELRGQVLLPASAVGAMLSPTPVPSTPPATPPSGPPPTQVPGSGAPITPPNTGSGGLAR